MKYMVNKFLGALFFLTIAHAASAGVLVDYSPDVSHGTSFVGWNFANESSTQNFVSAVTFSEKVEITGMDLYGIYPYSYYNVSGVGDGAIFKIFSSNNSLPSHGTLIKDVFTTISAIDTVGTSMLNSTQPQGLELARRHVEFANMVVVNAGTYWVGLSGVGKDMTQAALFGFSNPSIVQLSGDDAAADLSSYFGQMSYRLYGQQVASSVPEADAYVMLLAGLMILGAIHLRRKKLA